MEPDKVLESTTPEIKKLVEEILEIERDYQFHQNLDANRTLTNEVVEKIVKVFG